MRSPKEKRSKEINNEGIVMSKELSDNEINLAQHLLKLHFIKLNGQDSKLLRQVKLTENKQRTKSKLSTATHIVVLPP